MTWCFLEPFFEGTNGFSLPFNLVDQGSEYITLLGETFVVLIGELEERFWIDLGDQVVACILELHDLS